MDTPRSECHVCGGAFEVKFRYQVREEAGRFLYICSPMCQQRLLAADDEGVTCTVCAASFALEYPFQVAVHEGGRRYFCTTTCRQRALDAAAAAATPPAPSAPRRIAVFNHKGGTGKTTTAVNLAAGLAEAGKKVLLIDADGQGNVGASLGIRGEKTLYHVLVHGLRAEEVAVPVRQGLDVITSNEALAAAELYLAERPNRDRIMRERLGECVDGYDVVVIDCAPALSLMNQNALVFCDGVLIPVACDYLSLVGVRQVLRTLRNVHQALGHEVQILGALPTFFDTRNRIARDAREALEKYFGERCLPPIRVNTKLREAPSSRMSIFEYAAESNGAEDYRVVVRHVLGLASAGASVSSLMGAVPAVA
jgi:chromosome partitioning protein